MTDPGRLAAHVHPYPPGTWNLHADLKASPNTVANVRVWPVSIPPPGRFLDASDVITALFSTRPQAQMILKQDTEQLPRHHGESLLQFGVGLPGGLRIVQDGHHRVETLT